MSDTMWGLLALGGVGLVVMGNALRARRTGNMSCLGHFFVKAREMTGVELVLNRTGIAIFAVGIVMSVL